VPKRPDRPELKGDISLDYTHLGRTGLKVSRLALGSMNFGELTDDEKSSFSIMDEALGAGINFFDTAEKLDAASRAIDDLKSAVPILQKSVSQLQAAEKERHERPGTWVTHPLPMSPGRTENSVRAHKDSNL
jgi:hypothetical protein